MRRLVTPLIVATLVACVAPTLHAQRGNASDIGVKPGNGNNGSGSNGRGTGANNGNNGAPGTPGNPNRIIYASGATTAPAASPSVLVLSLSSITQRAGSAGAAQLAADVGSASAPRAELLKALLSQPGAPSLKQAESFVDRYAGVLNNLTPSNVAFAVKAFNGMVNSASAAYLAKPPAEFVAAQAVLKDIVTSTGAR